MGRKRRGRGEGGIRYREDKDLWVSEVRTGAGQKRRTVYGKTKAEVQEKIRHVHNDIAAGAGTDAGSPTVGQWLTRWLGLVKPSVEPNTCGPCERHVRLHITPHIGGLKLAKLGKAQVRGWYAALAGADVPAKVVSERLGHSSITLTLDAYSHVLPTMQRRAADRMGQILGRKDAQSGRAGNGGTMAVQE